jgi:uncharacterized protein DUF6881
VLRSRAGKRTGDAVRTEALRESRVCLDAEAARGAGMIREVRYQRVIWHHNFADEPTVLWSEITDDGFERRKVAEYRDGRLDYADENTGRGSTLLSDQPIPPIDEIDAEDEFTAAALSRADFESIWSRATRR